MQSCKCKQRLKGKTIGQRCLRALGKDFLLYFIKIGWKPTLAMYYTLNLNVRKDTRLMPLALLPAGGVSPNIANR